MSTMTPPTTTPYEVLTAAQTRAYLRRIGLGAESDRSPTLNTLARLQRAHMETVPFENLDVFLRRPLSLERDDLYEKIVTRRRGGYCFELNTLYAALLRSLGFDVRPRLARVWLRDPAAPPTRNHLTHLVTLDGRPYLTDVGFGGLTARQPFPIDTTAPFDDGEGRVRVVPDATYGRMFEREDERAWYPQYSFDDSHVTAQDVLAANHWMEHHPVSHFRENRFAARFHESGREGLFDTRLTTRHYRDGRHERHSEELAYGEAYLAALRERFGIELGTLTEPERRRLWGEA